MEQRPLVSRQQWLASRLDLLAAEKAHTQQTDALAARRRELPWVLVEQDYVFETTGGPKRLSELFAARRQLVVYHFMFGPDWSQGCHRCSFWADNFDGIDVHLAHRDTTFVAVSNTAVEKINRYRARMGWRFTWVSALNSTFNEDFHVSFSRAAEGDVYYNYALRPPMFPEMQGLSVFVRLGDDRVAHAYSTYGRGIDVFNGAYQILDLTPKGRDEDGHRDPMFWLKRRDQYPEQASV